jgi:ketosteroid isomerase-like protein
MSTRADMEQLLGRLYAARVAGEHDQLAALFLEDAHFRIAGAGSENPISISAIGITGIRDWLSMLIRSYRISHRHCNAVLIDGPKAAVHWSAEIHSKVTGALVVTEFIDLVEMKDNRIARYTEFFVPRAGDAV